MKTKIYFFAFVSVAGLATGCSSYEGTPPQSELTGTWHWTQSTGGISGATETPASTGNEITLEISATTVKKFTNGQFTSQLPYTTDVKPSIYGGDRTMMIFNNGDKQSFSINGSHLQLDDECLDCYQSKYVR